jgi:hypothetical protein
MLVMSLFAAVDLASLLIQLSESFLNAQSITDCRKIGKHLLCFSLPHVTQTLFKHCAWTTSVVYIFFHIFRLSSIRPLGEYRITKAHLHHGLQSFDFTMNFETSLVCNSKTAVGTLFLIGAIGNHLFNDQE